MPVDLEKRFVCAHPGCTKSFKKFHDLQRHVETHREYNERRFGCPYDGCTFRSNQNGGLEIHVAGYHRKLRWECLVPGCSKSYADPSGLTRHRQKLHPEVEGAKPQSRGRAKQLHNAPTRAPNPTSMRPLHSASVPSTSRQNHSLRSTSRGHPGGFHAATDVPSDRRSIDQTNQPLHQAYDANQGPAPTAGRSHQNAEPSSPLLNPAGPSTHPSQRTPSEANISQARHQQDCPCLECYIASLTLAPLRLDMGIQAEPQSAPCRLPKISYPRVDHVPPSELRVPPMNPGPLSAYPYGRMLFSDNRQWNTPRPSSTQSRIRTQHVDSASTFTFRSRPNE